MKWAVAVLAIAFALTVGSAAVAAPLHDNPGALGGSGTAQDMRSPDAVSGFVASDAGTSSDDGISAAMIVLLAVGGVAAFGGGAFVIRRAVVSHRHAVA